MRKPYTMKCQHCGTEFDTVSVKAFSGVMRRHAKHHPGVRPIKYTVTRSPGRSARRALKRKPT